MLPFNSSNGVRVMFNALDLFDHRAGITPIIA